MSEAPSKPRRGRPPVLRDGHALRIWIDDESVAIARQLGQDAQAPAERAVSLGIRLALGEANARRLERRAATAARRRRARLRRAQRPSSPE